MLIFIAILFAMFILLTIAEAVYETRLSARQSDIAYLNRMMESYTISKH